jgi:hypothetical protein
MAYPVFYPPESTTLYVPFATYDKDDGSSITMTGLAVTDIEIYKNGSVTQRASDAGYTLLDTDGIDVDGVTGIHGFSIDLSDNTDASFYAVGSWYTVVVSSVTVDAVTVNFIAAMFRILPAEATTGYQVVTTGAIATGAITAAALDATFQTRIGIKGNGTAQSAAAGNIVVAAGTGSLYKVGDLIAATGSTQGYAQTRSVSGVSTDTLSVSPNWDVTPSGTITYVVFNGAPASETALPTVLVSSGTGTGQISLSSGAVLLQATQTGVTIPTVTNLTNAPTAGDLTATMKTSVTTAATAATPTVTTGTLSANVITAASLAADAGTEIAAAVLAAAASNPIDANVQEINDVTLAGDGDGTPMGAA